MLPTKINEVKQLWDQSTDVEKIKIEEFILSRSPIDYPMNLGSSQILIESRKIANIEHILTNQFDIAHGMILDFLNRYYIFNEKTRNDNNIMLYNLFDIEENPANRILPKDLLDRLSIELFPICPGIFFWYPWNTKKATLESVLLGSLDAIKVFYKAMLAPNSYRIPYIKYQVSNYNRSYHDISELFNSCEDMAIELVKNNDHINSSFEEFMIKNGYY